MPDTQKQYAVVAFPWPPHTLFTYGVPPSLRPAISRGHRVVVPLGSRTVTGYVTGFTATPPQGKCKDITAAADPWPVLSAELLRLTKWVADYYIAGWGESIKCALPPGLSSKSVLCARIEESGSTDRLSDREQQVYCAVREAGTLPVFQLARTFQSLPVRAICARLQKKGCIRLTHIFDKNRVAARTRKKISLAGSIEPDQIPRLLRNAPAQERVALLLESRGRTMWRDEIDAPMSILTALREKGIISITEERVFRESFHELPVQPSEDIVLTPAQKKAVDAVIPCMNEQLFSIFLLFGITGSGKTQVYIESIAAALKSGKTALVLIPEISLTPQAVSRYRSVFGNRIAVLHSRMPKGERYDTWYRIKQGEFPIVIGPRSAVFAPLENLGLIIVDEEHDSSFKQDSPAPRYNARDVAVVRAKFNSAVALLGSATPGFESYYNALEGKYTLLNLPSRIDRTPLPKVVLVDQKKFLSEKTTRIFSPLLQEKIDTLVSSGSQVILLQNRRGYAPFIVCKSCGHIEQCKHCDITLTYHRSQKTLECHYCGYRQPAPDSCPVCGSVSLVYKGAGTEQIEEELETLFPDSACLRMDFDTTRGKGAYTDIIRKFLNHEADILLGTQMVAKGHDFSQVNLVGILSADTGLHFPDFRAGEKTFQLLTQAGGRSGRRDMQGEVIIQTMSPDHPVLSFVLTHDYEGFYRWETENRKELCYPPWGRLIAVTIHGKYLDHVEQAARLLRTCMGRPSNIIVLGPAPAPLSRVKSMHRFLIIIKSPRIHDPNGSNMRRFLKISLKKYYASSPPSYARIAVNVDPVNML